MSTIHVDIVSAEGAIYSGDAEMVIAPAKMGDIGVTPRHAPLLTNLRPGEIRVQLPDSEEELFFYVTGGVLEVHKMVRHDELACAFLRRSDQPDRSDCPEHP